MLNFLKHLFWIIIKMYAQEHFPLIPTFKQYSKYTESIATNQFYTRWLAKSRVISYRSASEVDNPCLKGFAG